MSKREFPIEIREVSPGPGAVKLTGKHLDGRSDGLHTGGAWLYQGKVWKPLDGRPFPNAQVHIETSEEDCLKALQGKPLFPKNWEIKESNGRRFLIRDKVSTFPGGGLSLTRSQIEEVGKGIAEMNRLKWEVNDDLVIGKDRSGNLFVVDLSAAQYSTGPHAYAADDSHHFDKLCDLAGFRDIPALKVVARELLVQILFNPKFKEKNVDKRKIVHIYSSEKMVEIDDAVDLTYLIDFVPPKDKEQGKKYLWLGTTKPISDSILRAHKITHRYSKKT